MKIHKLKAPCAVEQLIVSVEPEMVDKWLELDHEIWSRGLAEWPGYLRKEVWQSRERPGRLTVTIYWESLELWKAIDTEWLIETDNKFNERFLPAVAKIVEAPHEEEQNFLIAESGGREG